MASLRGARSLQPPDAPRPEALTGRASATAPTGGLWPTRVGLGAQRRRARARFPLATRSIAQTAREGPLRPLLGCWPPSDRCRLDHRLRAPGGRHPASHHPLIIVRVDVALGHVASNVRDTITTT